MSKLMVLMKVSFRALLSAIKLGSGKKKRMGGVGALLLFAGISVYISVGYSHMFGKMLFEAGLERFLIPLIAIIGFVLAVTMTVSAAGGFLFGGRDSDLVLSLPVSAFSVMLSKILALYLECFVFCALFLLPAGIVYIVYGGGGGAMLIIRLLIASAIFPILATLVCTILAYIITWVSAHTSHKSLVSSILMFAMIGLIFVFSFQINNLTAMLMQHAEQLDALFAGWLLPFGLLQAGIVSSWLALLEFFVICLVPFLAVAWVLSKNYKKILSALSGHSSRSDYKLGEVKTSGQFAALFKKEIRRYFGTTIYLFNTSCGAVMLLGLSVYAIFSKATIEPLFVALDGVSTLLPIVLGVVCGILSTVNTSCVSISLEGKTLWILKEAPISAQTLFASKAAVNLLVAWPTAIISLLLIGITFDVPPLELIAMLLVALALSGFISLMGLFINLQFPKMDCENDTIVVKQSASAMLGLFGGLVPVGLGVGLYILLKQSLSLPIFCLICTILLCALSALVWRYLCTKGAAKLLAL